MPGCLSLLALRLLAMSHDLVFIFARDPVPVLGCLDPSFLVSLYNWTGRIKKDIEQTLIPCQRCSA